MLLADHWRNAWHVPDRRPIYDWAAAGALILPPSYTISGQFHVELSRQLIDVFDALTDERTWMVTVIAPPRTGKSLIADIWFPSVMVREPGPCMWNLQTDKVAKDYAEERVHPLLRNSPAVKPIWPLAKNAANTQRVIFLNGVHLYIQGPAIGNLQTKGIRYQCNDETWLWKPGRLKEAHARTGDFKRIGTAKILNISQGSWEGDDTHGFWSQGDRSEWSTPCLHCGHYMQHTDFQPRRPDNSRWGLVWDKPVRGKLDHRPEAEFLGAILPTVRFECEKCAQPMVWSERTRAEWNRLGKYVSPLKGVESLKRESVESLNAVETLKPVESLNVGEPAKPDSTIQRFNDLTIQQRSFRWPALIATPWTDLVSEYIRAYDAYDRGVIELLTEFIQKKVPDFWSEARLLRSDPMTRETFDVHAKWDAEFARILTVDRQADGLHWGLVCAWNRTGEARRLWFGQLFSEAEIEAKQKEWTIPAYQVLIDSGFEPRVVFGMCVRHGWIATKGDPKEHFTVKRKDRYGNPTLIRSTIADPVPADPEIGKRMAGRKYANLIRFSHPATQDTVKRFLNRGRLICPTGGDEAAEKEWETQLKSEFPVIKVMEDSRRKRVWICPSGNNHLRDCFAMQVVAAKLKHILPDEVTEERVASS